MANYFSLAEFKSKDGASFPVEVVNNIFSLITQLNIIRDYINEPIYISSGYRTPEHNKAIGGVPNSMHIRGLAADIYTDKYSATQLFDIIKMLYNEGKINIGYMQLYPTHVHIDIGPLRGNWMG